MQPPRDLIGRTLQGRFVITGVLGEGAMGVVYRGFDEETRAEVAVKVLQPGLSENPEVVARFHREGAAARRVDHESTVRVLGHGSEEGLDFLVMELLQGRSLAAVLAESGRVSEARAARLVIQLAGALAAVHERGVLHRDVKPENIMLVEGTPRANERLKLLDFGIAKRLPSGVEDSFNTGEETRYGALLGTPEYMSPEQCMGTTVDARTDVYACGVLLYRLVTGRVPFDGENVHPLEVCNRHIGEEPAPPRERAPGIHPAMEAVILKALRKEPAERHQSAVELRDELARVLAGLEEIEEEETGAFVHEDLALAVRAVRAAAEPAVVAPAPPAAIEPPRRGDRMRAHLMVVAVAALAGMGVGTLLLAFGWLAHR